MPKIKTVRGAAKRFKKTASGGFKRKQSHLRHILTKKTTKRKRHLRHKSMVAKSDLVLVVACLTHAKNSVLHDANQTTYLLFPTLYTQWSQNNNDTLTIHNVITGNT